ncbi:hypothetical protein CEQ50_16615 [Vibrio anguillarum]|uniref:hypothetical protein n=1 Tax=Vibrio anguillarum TaxID=55601 RepID=UPI000B542E25|nr:hypothetical protein [Vibrio anguillarum]ASG09154.1 hypothetical protein CEQ50_16615 [Vibrio anguillarum]
MFDVMELINEVKQKEGKQSHSFFPFLQGSPYCILGWEKYRLFNGEINKFLSEFNKEFDVKVYVYEYEVIHVEDFFLWGFSFIQENPDRRDKLSDILIDKLIVIFRKYFYFKDECFLNNHREGFNNVLDPDLMKVYIDLVVSFEREVNLTYNPPKTKTYNKSDFDMSAFDEPVKVIEFVSIINDYMVLNSTEDLIYRFAPDGYFSNKFRSNKYLREEFVPLLEFIRARKISGEAYIKLGVQDENYDAKIIDKQKELIIEITLGAPKHDYLYQTATQSDGVSVLPLKVLAHLKKEIDSLAGRIILSIEKKHNRNYDDERLLLVVVQSEYTYQNEALVVDEVLKEVRGSISRGNFKEIVLMFGSKLYTL